MTMVERRSCSPFPGEVVRIRTRLTVDVRTNLRSKNEASYGTFPVRLPRDDHDRSLISSVPYEVRGLPTVKQHRSNDIGNTTLNFLIAVLATWALSGWICALG